VTGFTCDAGVTHCYGDFCAGVRDCASAALAFWAESVVSACGSARVDAGSEVPMDPD